MTDLALFDLETLEPVIELPARSVCGWGDTCRHPDHHDGTYQPPASVWGVTPCHECGEPLRRYLRVGHWNLADTSWAHLRGHAHPRTTRTLAMDGRLWIGAPA